LLQQLLFSPPDLFDRFHKTSCFRTPFADPFGAVLQHRPNFRSVHACFPLSFRSFIFCPPWSLIFSSAPPPLPSLIPLLGLPRNAARLAWRDCIVRESSSAAASSDQCRFSHRMLLRIFFMPVTLFFSTASVCFCVCASRRIIAPSFFIISPHGIYFALRPLLACFALPIACVFVTAPTTSYCIVHCLLLSFCDRLMLCAPHPLHGNPCCFTLARFCSGPGLVCPFRACVKPAYGVSGTF